MKTTRTVTAGVDLPNDAVGATSEISGGITLEYTFALVPKP